jgi:hypothetical protein
MIKWDETLHLLTEAEFNQLPDGFKLKCIDGTYAIKGTDYIDMDTRGGHIAFGIENIMNHPESELLVKLKLAGRIN